MARRRATVDPATLGPGPPTAEAFLMATDGGSPLKGDDAIAPAIHTRTTRDWDQAAEAAN